MAKRDSSVPPKLLGFGVVAATETEVFFEWLIDDSIKTLIELQRKPGNCTDGAYRTVRLYNQDHKRWLLFRKESTIGSDCFLKPRTLYTYRMRAFNHAGSSNWKVVKVRTHG